MNIDIIKILEIALQLVDSKIYIVILISLIALRYIYNFYKLKTKEKHILENLHKMYIYNHNFSYASGKLINQLEKIFHKTQTLVPFKTRSKVLKILNTETLINENDNSQFKYPMVFRIIDIISELYPEIFENDFAIRS